MSPRRWVAIAAGTVAAALLTGCSGDEGAAARSGEGSVLQGAYDRCSQVFNDAVADLNTRETAADHMALGDGGKSLTVGGGGGSARGNLLIVECLIYALEIPDSTVAKVNQTNAVMGRQSDSWGDLQMSWSYHPNSGVSAVLEQVG